MTRVHQVCARLQFGDAVTNHVLAIHRLLGQWGAESHVYANTADAVHAADNEGEQRYRRGFMSKRDDLLIYHYSVYNPNHRLYLRTRNRRVFVYHNITPPEFFDPWHREIAEVCRRGRALLPELKGCDLALGDSDFNRRELVEAGFPEEKTSVLPILLSEEKMSRCDPDLLERLRGDDSLKLLFVGRLVPNKKIEDLLDFFAYYRRVYNWRSRLFVVGSSWSVSYNRLLYERVRRLGLAGRVEFPGGAAGVSDQALSSYFQGCDLFITMSEHEGFCVPLVEAMYHGLPAFAYACAAVPDTLGGSGALFYRKDWRMLGAALEEVRHDPALREGMVERQRRRYRELSPDRTAGRLRELLRPFLEGEGERPSL
jgi:glycosyltransferase involved in cell wall biosynthesis